MSVIERVDHWATTHQYAWLAVLRVLLGLIIFIKGISFIANNEEVLSMVADSRLAFGSFIIVHYVIMVHIPGGLMIMAGLKTRIAILFQLPVLIGAVVFINAQHGIFSMDSELWLSIIVLALLLFFCVYGSGPYSMDSYMERHKEEE